MSDEWTVDDLRRACRATALILQKVEPHLDVLWSLAYEQAVTSEVRVKGGDLPDLTLVGDAKARELLAELKRATDSFKPTARKIMRHLDAGDGLDRNLRGSGISKSEYKRLRKTQERRTTDMPATNRERPVARLHPQPPYPGKGHR